MYFRCNKEKLLGCLVSQDGIQARPEKVAAIQNMLPLRSKSEVQKLASRIASLNRLSRSQQRKAHHSLPCCEVERLNGEKSSKKSSKN